MDNSRLKIVDLTFVVDTGNVYANNDLVADTAILTGALFDIDRPGIIESVLLIDEDDNTAIPLVVYFLDSSGSLGTFNAALSPTDAVVRTILGYVAFAAADFKDTINSKVALKTNLGIPVKPASGTRNIYIAIAIDGNGTPTYTVSGLKARIGIRS